MKTKQIIKALRTDGDPTRYLATEAANRLEMLSAELKKLHGKLEAMKEERNAAIRDLRGIAACYTCAENGVTCHVDTPIPGHNVSCGGYVWRGAEDTNVPSKPAGREINVMEKYYVVTKGDCTHDKWPWGYQRIADRFGVNVEDLLRVNKLTWDNPPVPGLKLWIPKMEVE